MNPALTITLKSIAYTLAVVLASPLLEGIMRKVKAIVHSRKGPPIRQPYLDLVKLLVKEDLVSESDVFARYAPPLAFAATLAAAFFVPFGVIAPAQVMGDLFPFIYLITLSSTCVMVGGLAHGSPFSHLGSSREMMMVLTVEATVIIAPVGRRARQPHPAAVGDDRHARAHLVPAGPVCILLRHAGLARETALRHPGGGPGDHGGAVHRI